MKIIVIGGNGFVGQSLVQELINEKHDVTVFDKVDALKKNNHKNLSFINGDIFSESQIDSAIKKHDIVYHLAGMSDLNETLYKPLETIKYNIIGTVNILQSCVKHKLNVLFLQVQYT